MSSIDLIRAVVGDQRAFLTVADLSALTGRTCQALYILISRGQMPIPVRRAFGGGKRGAPVFLVSDVAAWLDNLPADTPPRRRGRPRKTDAGGLGKGGAA